MTTEWQNNNNDPLVRCVCGWVGRTSLLVDADGCRHCPDCGEFFQPLPSPPAAGEST
jgi:hypothetical protein